MTEPSNGSPERSPWPNLIAFVAVLIFGGVGIASNWSAEAITAVAGALVTLYGIWRFGPRDD
jgi:hypothetical protein